MMYSHELLFILEHYFAQKSSVAVHEAFSSAHGPKHLRKKDGNIQTRNKISGDWRCLLQMLYRATDELKLRCTHFKQYINCNNRIRLKEFNPVIGLVVLCEGVP
jgi:hypothetical protein